jgi:hypothetical protein
MDIIRHDSPTARALAAAIAGEDFTVADVGCSGGIDPGWRLFGDRLRAFGFDPSIDEIARLTAAETSAKVRYVAGFVGLPDGHPLKGAAVEPWLVDPWWRLSACRTRLLHQARDKAAAEATRAEPAPAEPAPVETPSSPAPEPVAPEPAAEPAALEQQELMARSLWAEPEVEKEDLTIVLPDFLAEQGAPSPDFIKIDVDGTDFEILRSLDEVLADKSVLGAMLEVTYHGSDEPDFSTFHNTDRFMRAHGFDLFSLTTRPYSHQALPRPFQHPYPYGAQTTGGRIMQGDALYLRDYGHGRADRDLAGLSDDRLLKLGALYALFGHLDTAGGLLLHFRERLSARIDVDAILDLMTQEVQDADPELWEERRFASYRDYMAAYEAGDPAFYAANDRRHQKSLQPLRDRDRALEDLAEARREIERLRLELDAASRRGLLGRLLGR